MSRYTGPQWKKSRRLGFSTLETGKELERRPYAPGMHGQKRKKQSEYGLQMAEKQKVRFMYGVSEKQFRHTYERATKMEGIAGYNFLSLLELRLDNIVYRAGFASTRRQARQFVTHEHVLVNGKKVNIPSYEIKAGDVITFKMSNASDNFKALLKSNQTRPVPAWMDVNYETMTAVFNRKPNREEFAFDINEQLIVELYNK